MQDQSARPEQTKSTFVTVVAWIFIVFAAFATFVSALQNIMFYTMFSPEKMHFPSGKQAEDMPAFFVFMTEHIQIMFVAFFVVSAGTLAAAVGLLHRKNWARLVFIAILGFGIVWNAGGIFLQQLMLSSMHEVPTDMPPDFRAEFDRMASIMRVVSLVFALGFCTLFGWLIKRLVSRPVRDEFVGLS